MENHQIEGRRAVREALQAKKIPDKVFILRTAEGIGGLIKDAKDAGATIVDCDKTRLDQMSQTGGNHQGIIARLAECDYSEIDDIFKRAESRGEQPFIIVCDSVEDERNLGAIIRTAEAAGAHGVIVPKRRSAGLSAVTVKASAGAALHLPVARTPGVPMLLRELKERNIWVYGADADGEKDVFQTDFSGAVAIVVGSEGRGISRLAAEHCDFLVSIPMKGEVSSLNVSTACGIFAYQVLKSRL